MQQSQNPQFYGSMTGPWPRRGPHCHYDPPCSALHRKYGDRYGWQSTVRRNTVALVYTLPAQSVCSVVSCADSAASATGSTPSAGLGSRGPLSQEVQEGRGSEGTQNTHYGSL
jgi:hypothetical protein